MNRCNEIILKYVFYLYDKWVYGSSLWDLPFLLGGGDDFIYYSDISVTSYVAPRCTTECKNGYEWGLIIYFCMSLTAVGRCNANMLTK